MVNVRRVRFNLRFEGRYSPASKALFLCQLKFILVVVLLMLWKGFDQVLEFQAPYYLDVRAKTKSQNKKVKLKSNRPLLVFTKVKLNSELIAHFFQLEMNGIVFNILFKN